MKDKPALPEGFDYKKAITDYFRELGKVIKKSIAEKWDINFFTQTLIVLTVSKIKNDYRYFIDIIPAKIIIMSVKTGIMQAGCLITIKIFFF